MYCNAHTIFSGVIIMLYTWCFLLVVSRFVAPIKGAARLLTACFGVINGVIGVFLLSYQIRISDAYIVSLIIIFLEIAAVFHFDIHVHLLAALHLGVHLVTLRSFSICIIALSNPVTLFSAMTAPVFRFFTFILTYGLMFLFLIGNYFLLRRENIQVFFKHKRQMSVAYVSATVLCVYQYLCTKAFYYTVELEWFIILQLVSAVFMLLAYYFIFICSVKVSTWVTSTVENARLEQNLRMQLSHYEAYARSEQAIKIFKHDYKNLVLTVSSLLVNNQPQKALMMLEQMDHRLQENVMVHRVYSTNVLINAALLELANECITHGIEFNAGIVLPKSMDNEGVELSALFAMLAKISVECCKQVPDNRRIDMFSTSTENWLTLSIEFTAPNAKTAVKTRESLEDTIEFQATKSLVSRYEGFDEISYSKKTTKLFIHLNILPKEGERL